MKIKIINISLIFDVEYRLCNYDFDTALPFPQASNGILNER